MTQTTRRTEGEKLAQQVRIGIWNVPEDKQDECISKALACITPEHAADWREWMYSTFPENKWW